MQSPPARLRLTDELGTAKTAPDGHDTLRASSGRDWLVLGLGPDPAALAASLPGHARVRYVECPDFEAQAPAAWRDAIPEGWERAGSFDPAQDTTILLYKGAQRLFPGFWSPVLARLALPRPGGPSGSRVALMPGAPGRLIASETAQALEGAGFEVRSVPPGELARELAQGRPDLFLSVNFAGLDEYGLNLALLARAGTPVAVWLVDNPFHALSGQKNALWKQAHLFVTDGWFVRPLRELGARSVHHLPLAASPGFFAPGPAVPEVSGKLLFVGRSSFPGRDGFFAGLVPAQQAMDEALSMLERGERPDFGWWSARLGIDSFWPGKQARLAGLGAELCGRAWRTMVIEAAARAGELCVCGDEAWRGLVRAPFSLLPPVDYFGPLAGMYARARCVVGAVSPLLPHGLTQRHFDVWAAGGLLVTDETPGLSIFPEELVRQSSYRAPGEIGAAIERAEARRQELIEAWRALIGREHTYPRRIDAILAVLTS